VQALIREFAEEINLLGGPVEPLLMGFQKLSSRQEQPSLWLSLSYGAKADTKLIERIKQTVATYAEQWAKARQ
jgi:hypothetical protein